MENLSLVSDQDYSATTKEMARTQIIQQAATAMLVQANQQPSTVMFLLRWIAKEFGLNTDALCTELNH